MPEIITNTIITENFSGIDESLLNDLKDAVNRQQLIPINLCEITDEANIPEDQEIDQELEDERSDISVQELENHVHIEGMEVDEDFNECTTSSSLEKTCVDSSPSSSKVKSTFQVVTYSTQLDRERVPGDGNCFFHAVARQLQHIDYLKKHTPSELRELTVKGMENNIECYRKFYNDKDNKGITFEQHLKRMKQEGEWADEPEICALTEALNLQIVLYIPGKQEPHLQYGNHQVKINLYYNGSDHYDSLLLKQKNVLSSPVSPLSAAAESYSPSSLAKFHQAPLPAIPTLAAFVGQDTSQEERIVLCTKDKADLEPKFQAALPGPS